MTTTLRRSIKQYDTERGTLYAWTILEGANIIAQGAGYTTQRAALADASMYEQRAGGQATLAIDAPHRDNITTAEQPSLF